MNDLSLRDSSYSNMSAPSNIRSRLRSTKSASGSTTETKSAIHTNKNFIHDVPPELAERIAVHLPSKDLLQLRLVSKEVAARTEIAMLKANFSRLTVVFSLRSSLERALKIARHPFFKRFVSLVTFYVDQFDSEAPGDIRRLRFSAPAYASVSASRRLRDNQLTVYTRLVEDQEEMIRSNTDQDYTTQILTQLQANGEDIGISIHEMHRQLDTQGRVFIPKGAIEAKDCHELSTDTYVGDIVLAEDVRDHRPLRSILSAISQSKVQLIRLNLHYRKVPARVFGPTGEFADLHSNVSHLKSFSLSFEAATEQQYLSTEDTDIESFITFLGRIAPKLRILGLNSESRRGLEETLFDKIFARMLHAPRFPALTALSVRNLETDYQRFLDHLQRHKSTLKTCHTTSINATGCGPRRPLKEWSAKLAADLNARGLPIFESSSLHIRNADDRSRSELYSDSDLNADDEDLSVFEDKEEDDGA